jgi:hypothetical protein
MVPPSAASYYLAVFRLTLGNRRYKGAFGGKSRFCAVIVNNVLAQSHASENMEKHQGLSRLRSEFWKRAEGMLSFACDL